MKTIKMTLLALVASVASVMAQTSWNLDRSHSKVGFSVDHMVISEVAGDFQKFEAKVSSKADDFVDANIDFTIDTKSINTNEQMRDDHLRSDDFFNAEKYPAIKFKGKSLKKVKDNNYVLSGDLTIRDVTKPVTFAVKYGGTIVDPYKNTRAGFRVSGTINRLDYGLKYNPVLEAGGAAVGSEVRIIANLEFIKQK